MLHIKLPKRVVASACLRRAAFYRRQYAVADERYVRRMEEWSAKIKAASTESKLMLPILPPDAHHFEYAAKAKKFGDMAAACSRSVGDVYVSSELWVEIEEAFDA